MSGSASSVNQVITSLSENINTLTAFIGAAPLLYFDFSECDNFVEIQIETDEG